MCSLEPFSSYVETRVHRYEHVSPGKVMVQNHYDAKGYSLAEEIANSIIRHWIEGIWYCRLVLLLAVRAVL